MSVSDKVRFWFRIEKKEVEKNMTEKKLQEKKGDWEETSGEEKGGEERVGEETSGEERVGEERGVKNNYLVNISNCHLSLVTHHNEDENILDT